MRAATRNPTRNPDTQVLGTGFGYRCGRRWQREPCERRACAIKPAGRSEHESPCGVPAVHCDECNARHARLRRDWLTLPADDKVTDVCHRFCTPRWAGACRERGKTAQCACDAGKTRANLRQHMLARLQTFSLVGIDAVPMEVEVSV